MQTVSETYKNIKLSGAYREEIKLTVDGVEYEQHTIVSLATYASRFSADRKIGCAISAEIDLQYFPGAAEPPRMAEIRIYSRLVTDTQESEWIPRGVFFFDTRDKNRLTGLLTVHGYDAMIKAEQPFLDEDGGDTGEWPRPASTVVNQIAAKMGVNVDSRTVLDNVMVAYPNDFTCRELLMQIAGAHAGNWIMSGAGELWLQPLNSEPPETFYLMTEDGYEVTFGDDEDRILIE